MGVLQIIYHLDISLLCTTLIPNFTIFIFLFVCLFVCLLFTDVAKTLYLIPPVFFVPTKYPLGCKKKKKKSIHKMYTPRKKIQKCLLDVR